MLERENEYENQALNGVGGDRAVMDQHRICHCLRPTVPTGLLILVPLCWFDKYIMPQDNPEDTEEKADNSGL